MKTRANVWHVGMVLMAGLAFSLAGCGGDRPAPEMQDEADVVDAVENQQVCPVMPNMAIDRSIYVDHEGKRVYFCCPGCVGAFRADPERYLEKLRALQEEPDAAPEIDHGHDHG